MPKSAEAGTTPDNRPRTIVEAQAAPDNARIALKLPLPQRLADQNHTAATGHVLAGGKHAPERRRDAEHRQESVGDIQRRDARRVTGIRVEVGFAGNERGEIGRRDGFAL